MHLAIPLTHLDLVLAGVGTDLPADALVARLRQHFAFLGPVDVMIADGVAYITGDDAALAKQQEAGRLAERAAKRAREGDFARAVELYERVLQLHPTLATAHRELAMCLMELGRLDAAKDALIDALKLAPADAWSFVVLGNVYARLAQPALAKRFQLRALELKPGDAWALNGLAAAEMALGETDAGIAHFAEATRLHPTFANAWLGKALAEHNAGRSADTDLTLRGLFAHARVADTRDHPVFTQARRLFIEAQTALVAQQESDAFKATQALRTEVETLSGHAVDIVEEKLPAGIAGRAQMAWKHGRARHRISICPQDPPPQSLALHLQCHELTHIQLEAEARVVGLNRFFATTPATQAAALADLAPDIRRIAKNFPRADAASELAAELVAGTCGLVFNVPLDLLIERRLHTTRPPLRAIQLLSLQRLAREAADATLRPEIRKITPPKILRIACALNGLAALFLDDLSGGATDAFAPYAALDTADTSRRLWTRWQELAATWTPAAEYAWVDEFADLLGIRTWFTWKPDPGPSATTGNTADFPPRVEEPDLTLEGTTNPELLRAKHPAAVWFLLDTLQRFAAMSMPQIHALTLEVARVGQEGLDYASADKKYTLRALPGEHFSGLQLMCFMFAGFKRIAPEMDAQMDLEEPFLGALQLFNKQRGER